MRHLSKRASRPRALVMLGAISVVTLAASGPISSAARGTPAGAAGARSAALLGVSCPSADLCVAVGTGANNQTLAEKWDGKTWRITPTARPRGATSSNFYAVSCSSSHACMAVGGYETKAHPRRRLPLAEAWNGQTWRVKATPQPTSYSSLDGVSCYSANRCMAVGFALRASANNAFSEAWNGRSWSIKAIPRPPGTSYSNLDGVSCASASVCMAVGGYQLRNSADSRTLAEAWNGKQWARGATPNPASGANGSDLNGVSCRAADACVAVGLHANATNSAGLALTETWNGKIWTLGASGNGATSAGSALEGVSCVSTSACVAVGSQTTSAFVSSTLAQRWSGGPWTTETTPTPNGASQSDLDAVSCGSPRACVAVGIYFTDSGPGGVPLPVAEVWNGATWAIATIPF